MIKIMIKAIMVLYLRLRRKLAFILGCDAEVTHWNGLLQTHILLPVVRGGFDINKLPAVNLEINTHCNYRCSFCPTFYSPREARYMSKDDFLKVVSYLKGHDFDDYFVLCVNNEPFLHPLLMEFCETASKALPKAKIKIISNGSLIKEEHLKFLNNLPNKPILEINDYTKELGVARRIREIIKQNEEWRKSVIIVERSPDEKLSSRSGNVPKTESLAKDYRKMICLWPFTGMFINWDLDVFLCCSDYRHEMKFGNLKTQSLMEIWKSADMQKVREAHLIPDRSAIALCSRCDSEWWKLPDYMEKNSDINKK